MLFFRWEQVSLLASLMLKKKAYNKLPGESGDPYWNNEGVEKQPITNSTTYTIIFPSFPHISYVKDTVGRVRESLSTL